jgi:hypothetical protein
MIGHTLPAIRSTDTLFIVNDYNQSVDLSGPTASCQCGSSKETGLPYIHIWLVPDGQGASFGYKFESKGRLPGRSDCSNGRNDFY